MHSVSTLPVTEPSDWCEESSCLEFPELYTANTLAVKWPFSTFTHCEKDRFDYLCYDENKSTLARSGTLQGISGGGRVLLVWLEIYLY